MLGRRKGSGRLGCKVWEAGHSRQLLSSASASRVCLVTAAHSPWDLPREGARACKNCPSSSILGSWLCSPTSSLPPAPGIQFSLHSLQGLLDSGGLLPTADINVPTEPPCLLGAGLAGCLPPALSAPTTRRAGDIQDPGLEAHPTSHWAGRYLVARGGMAQGAST